MLSSRDIKIWKFNMQLTAIFFVKALYDAAKRGDVSAVIRLVTAQVNVDCTPFEVLCVHCMYSLFIVVIKKSSSTGWWDPIDGSII